MGQRCYHDGRIDVTLGDLIVAVSDAALDVSRDRKVAYVLAGLVLEQILKKSPVQKNRLAALSEDPSADDTFGL